MTSPNMNLDPPRHTRKKVKVLLELISLIAIVVIIQTSFYPNDSLANTARHQSKYRLNFYKRNRRSLEFEDEEDSQDEPSLGFVSAATVAEGGPAIAAVVSNRIEEVDNLCTTLKTLAFLNGDDDDEHLAPVLVFHEDNLTPDQVTKIVQSTNRPVAFPIVDLKSFPEGFKEEVSPDDEEEGSSTNGTVSFNPEEDIALTSDRSLSKWKPTQVKRFWITALWKHPAISQFDTIMRIDSDSCFREFNDYLPNFPDRHLVYQSHFAGTDYGMEAVSQLYDFTREYLRKQGIRPKNTKMWEFVTAVWETQGTLPYMKSQLEVMDKKFMQSSDVKQWHEALSEKEPFGVLKYKWGDAITRFLTVSIFAEDDQIATVKLTGYYHGEECNEHDVEAAMAYFG